MLDWRLREFNACHSPETGQFCSEGGGEAVGVSVGTRSGDWQVKWYSFPREGGAYQAQHLKEIPLKALDDFRPDGGKEQSRYLEQLAAVRIPKGAEAVYRIGRAGSRSLAGRNGANADGLINFLDRSHESLTATGDTVHVYAVTFLKPPGGTYTPIRQQRTREFNACHDPESGRFCSDPSHGHAAQDRAHTQKVGRVFGKLAQRYGADWLGKLVSLHQRGYTLETLDDVLDDLMAADPTPRRHQPIHSYRETLRG